LDLDSLPTETLQSDLVVSAVSALETNTYAMDVNVVLDLTKERKNEDTIRRLLGFSLYGKGQVCVTAEFVTELQKHSANFPKDPVLAFAKALPTLPRVASEVLAPIVEQLAPIVFPDRHRKRQLKDSDLSDLSHLAQCIHHEVTGFITSDGAVLRAQEEMYKQFNIQVLSPDEAVSSTVQSEGAIPKALCISHKGERLSTEIFC
jgi:predicted nucleic acid-binding protein